MLAEHTSKKRRHKHKRSSSHAGIVSVASLGCAAIVGLGVLLPAHDLNAQQVFKCKSTGPDGSSTTTFSSTPCASNAAQVHVSGQSGMVYEVGKSDPDIEVHELLAAVDGDIEAGVRSKSLDELHDTIIEEVSSSIEQARASAPGARVEQGGVEIQRKLASFRDELADVIQLAVLEACQDGARRVCAVKERVAAALQPALLRQEARRRETADPQVAATRTRA